MTAGFRNETVTFEIVEQIGVLNKKENGWQKEANIVVWNHREPKLDIREWDATHQRMSKGIVLTDDEVEVLIKALNEWKGAKK